MAVLEGVRVRVVDCAKGASTHKLMYLRVDYFADAHILCGTRWHRYRHHTASAVHEEGDYTDSDPEQQPGTDAEHGALLMPPGRTALHSENGSLRAAGVTQQPNQLLLPLRPWSIPALRYVNSSTQLYLYVLLPQLLHQLQRTRRVRERCSVG